MDFAKMSITKVKEWLDQLDEELPLEMEQMLLSDKRKGVTDLINIYQQKREMQKKLAQKWQDMSLYEQQLRDQGNQVILGIDEVGRGPLAGPVVACAVALPEDFYLPGLNDSKKVSLAARESFYERITREALYVGLGIVDAQRIDEINILEATREAMILAVQNTGCTAPDACLIDAVHIPNLPYKQIPIIGGDGKSVSIAAASIVAKVTRDKLMEELGKEYPGYAFEKNAGYGTAEHLEAIRRLGPSPIHRLSFGGVKEEQIS